MTFPSPPYRRDHRPGEYFTWAELTTTSTGLANEPDSEAKLNLRKLCFYFLDPLRRELGPIRVNSGYRSAAVNTAVNGALRSAHLDGRAADIVSYRGDFDTWDIAAEALDLVLPFDQLIIYHGGWVHIGFRDEQPRRQLLYRDRSGFYKPIDPADVYAQS